MIRLRHLALVSLLLACNNQQGTPAPATSSPPGNAAPTAEGPADATPTVPSPDAPSPDAPSPSSRAAIGQPAPDFTLTDLEGKTHRLADHRGKIVVLEWFNPGCPYVRQSHEHGTLKGLGGRLAEGGVVWLAINSNAPGKQGSGAEANREGVDRFAMTYPVLLDERGEVGKAYGATHTPHMYVIDREGVLVYAGAIDNSRGGDLEDVPAVESYVELAVAAVEAGKPVDEAETKAFGCTVKYAAP